MKRKLMILWLIVCPGSVATAALKTWDGKHDIDRVEVAVVYYVPSDRQPLPDWRARIDYYCRRIETFHSREFGEQSTLHTRVQNEPFVSEYSTAQLRAGDANFIFFKTLREVETRLKFAQGQQTAFPILLVLSDINWRPLDDFYRLHPKNGRLVFEGNYNRGEHFPGAASGGARATYLANRGVGWGLVSADGWRVPYRGSDCVVYHEGCGHTVGLPHPEPGNGSVMSLGQYRGWISESWLDKEQKIRLGWKPRAPMAEPQSELFTLFRALPEPRVPQPDQPVSLKLDWPPGSKVKSLRVRLQTDLWGPWVDVVPVHPSGPSGDPPATLPLGTFDRATPVSYRLDAELHNGAAVELRGYFQVRTERSSNPIPPDARNKLVFASGVDIRPHSARHEEIDLLKLADPKTCWMKGDWQREQGRLESPKAFGAKFELPYEAPEEYQLTVIAEPLDDANGLILGQRLGGRRFLALVNFARGDAPLSALENVDGRNVGNPTTYRGAVLRKGRLSQIVVTARSESVTVAVDGHQIIHLKGKPDRLSLSEYWNTPQSNALFLGAYDCRYRFYRISLEPLRGTGRELRR